MKTLCLTPVNTLDTIVNKRSLLIDWPLPACRGESNNCRLQLKLESHHVKQTQRHTVTIRASGVGQPRPNSDHGKQKKTMLKWWPSRHEMLGKTFNPLQQY